MTTGALVGVLIAAAAWGLLPLLVGIRADRRTAGVIGLLVACVAAAVGGVILAAPASIISTVVILAQLTAPVLKAVTNLVGTLVSLASILTLNVLGIGDVLANRLVTGFVVGAAVYAISSIFT